VGHQLGRLGPPICRFTNSDARIWERSSDLTKVMTEQRVVPVK
jgi:hypothetical protein